MYPFQIWILPTTNTSSLFVDFQVFSRAIKVLITNQAVKRSHGMDRSFTRTIGYEADHVAHDHLPFGNLCTTKSGVRTDSNRFVPSLIQRMFYLAAPTKLSQLLS